MKLFTNKGRIIHRWLTIFACCGSLLLLADSYKSRRSLQPQDIPSDSVERLQSYLNENYNKIDVRYQLLFARDQAITEQNNWKIKAKAIQDSLNTFPKFDTKNICSGSNAKTEEQGRKDLKAYYYKMFRLEADKKWLDSNVNIADGQVNTLENQAKTEEKGYKEISSHLAEMARYLSGAGVLVVKKVSYRFFIATKGDHDVHIYTSNGTPTSIETLKKQMMDKKKEPLMITNAGMFSPEFKPQGLLIEDFKKYKDLDTTKPDPTNEKRNFYLLPNGVFLIDSVGFYNILETDAYYKQYRSPKQMPQFATQSGPLLLSNGNINKNFRAGSMNVNIRSGVGLMNSEKVVFVISDSPVNFYDFTILFKEVFQCKNSLYLDGAISQMYISEKMLKEEKTPGPERLGPMISITKRKSK